MTPPAWLRLMKGRIPDRIAQLGKAVFNTSDTDDTILVLENFFKLIESPIRMNEIGIGEDKKPEILDMMIKNKVNGMNLKLSKDDIEKILESMFKKT